MRTGSGARAPALWRFHSLQQKRSNHHAERAPDTVLVGENKFVPACASLSSAVRTLLLLSLLDLFWSSVREDGESRWVRNEIIIQLLYIQHTTDTAMYRTTRQRKLLVFSPPIEAALACLERATRGAISSIMLSDRSRWQVYVIARANGRLAAPTLHCCGLTHKLAERLRLPDVFQLSNHDTDNIPLRHSSSGLSTPTWSSW